MSLKQFLMMNVLVIIGLIFRFLIPIPGLEPIIGVIGILPKKYSYFLAILFVLLNVIIFDVLTVGFGIWTVGVLLAYILIAYGYSKFCAKIMSMQALLLATVIMTICFDIFTGLLLGPLFFGQSFVVALVGQIPFTVAHLIGNVLMIVVYGVVTQGARWFGCEERQEAGYEANNA